VNFGGSIIPECGISRRARILRMVWDKYATGYNREKWGKGMDGGPYKVCPTCDVADIQRHILVDCIHDKVRQHRTRALQELDAAVATQGDSPAGRVLRAMRTLVTEHHQGYTILTGMISPDILQLLPVGDISQLDYNKVRSTMKKVFLHTEQMYLEWGRQGRVKEITQRKRKAAQPRITRWMTASTTRLAAAPEDENGDSATDYEASRHEEHRRTRVLHDKRQWDR